MKPAKRNLCWVLSAFLGTIVLLATVIAYSQYLTLKQTLLSKLSDRATTFLGQKTEIGDISFSALSGVVIDDLMIRNPDGFAEGRLLKIRKIQLAMRYSELWKGRFSFRSIRIDSPALSLARDEKKRLNVSETLRAFLTKKGDSRYQIDEVIVSGAEFSLDGNPLYRVHNIDASIENLSSDSGVKTGVKVSMTVPGENRLTMNGWAHLNDSPRKFGSAVSAENIDLSLLKEMLGSFGKGIEKNSVSMTATAEGDLDKRVSLTADILIKSRGFLLFGRDLKEVSVSAHAFLDTLEGSLFVSRAVLAAGDGSSLQMKGTVHDLAHHPAYSAEIKIDRLDLSAFNILKDVKAGGIVTSDVIRISGSSFSAVPEASGTVTVRDGLLSTEAVKMQKLNAVIDIALGKEISAQAETSASITSAGPYVFTHPVDLKLTAATKGRPGNMTFSSRLLVSDAAVSVKGKDARLENLDVSFDGMFAGRVISGSASCAAKGLSYDTYRVKDLRSGLALRYDGKQGAATGLHAESGTLKAAADSVSTELQGKGKAVWEVRNLHISYPEMNAELDGMDFTASLLPGSNTLSGDISFIVQKASFQDISAKSITGKGSLGAAGFSLDIPHAAIFNGTATLTAKGQVKGGPFPVSVEAHAERIRVEDLLKAARQFIAAPYQASGELHQLSFKGTLSSPADIVGTASMKGKNLSVTNTENRSLVKDLSLNAAATFQGKDAGIKADASVGNLSASLSGVVEDFAGEERSLRFSLVVPEAKAGDLRNAFWDVVPDRLLYAGLEGGIALSLVASYDRGAVAADGFVLLREISIEGENGEYAAGPLNGMVPIHFNSTGESGASMLLPSFERRDFEELQEAFSGARQFFGNEIRIGSVRYGFRLFEDVSLWVEQKGRALKINRFSAKMFGGMAYGSAVVDLAEDLNYRAGLIVDGVSLTRLCDDIPPIKGYISGRVNGIAMIKGPVAGLEKMIGKADFWTFSDGKEKMRISREFLQKIGGPQVRAYLGERRFDRGVMSFYIQNGFVVFRELEISNRSFPGITDLSVKVAPLNNRIAIGHLMWTITEAAQRARQKMESKDEEPVGREP